MEKKKPEYKGKSKEYPANTLNQAIEFLMKLKDYPHDKPIAYSIAANEIGVSATTKSFTYLLSSARQYGLITTSSGKTLKILENARRLIRPTESEYIINELKKECFNTPKLYIELIQQYNEQSLPPLETLINVLINFHGILVKAAKSAAQTFIDTAFEVGVAQNGVLVFNMTSEPSANGDNDVEDKQESSGPADIDTIGAESEGYDAPLSIPFGEKKKAMLYMPIGVDKEDAEYALEMIKLMFKKVYGMNN